MWRLEHGTTVLIHQGGRIVAGCTECIVYLLAKVLLTGSLEGQLMRGYFFGVSRLHFNGARLRYSRVECFWLL